MLGLTVTAKTLAAVLAVGVSFEGFETRLRFAFGVTGAVSPASKGLSTASPRTPTVADSDVADAGRSDCC